MNIVVVDYNLFNLLFMLFQFIFHTILTKPILVFYLANEVSLSIPHSIVFNSNIKVFLNNPTFLLWQCTRTIDFANFGLFQYK